MKVFLMIVILVLSGSCLSEPVNMEAINSSHLDAEPTFSVDGKEMYLNCHEREGRLGKGAGRMKRKGGEGREKRA